MSDRKHTGVPWRVDLPFSPKKHKAFEDRLESESPVAFDHKINEVLRRTPPHPMEIADSDEDDDEDEDDFPDLDSLMGTHKPFAKPVAVKNSVPSPSVDKRSTAEKLKDFMKIIADIKEADELEEVRKLADGDANESSGRASSAKLEGRALLERAVDTVKDEDGGDDSDKEQHYVKIRQALNRQVSANAAASYRFFAPGTVDSLVPTAPTQLDLGSLKGAPNAHRWSLTIQSKLASKYLRKPDFTLPDELVLWILDVYPTERSDAARAEYLQLLTQEEKQLEQVGRLITKQRLRRWLIDIGADEDAVSLGEDGDYVGQSPGGSRDWSPFHRIMELLRGCCGRLPVDTLIYAAVVLLRAGMDNEVRLQATLATAINDTLIKLANSVPNADREIYCRNVCNLFIQTAGSVSLLARIVEVTRHVGPQLLNDPNQAPLIAEPLKDLRTRLQLSVFFKDAVKSAPELCGTAPLLVQSILQRLDEPDFKGHVGPGGGRAVINYYDLDGYGLALTEIIPLLHSLRQSMVCGQAAVGGFNGSVDALRRKISFINSTIQTVGPMEDIDAKYEAKTRWTALDYRVSHFFPRAGRAGGVFDDDDGEVKAEKIDAEARGLKKSQGVLANFLQSKRTNA